MSVAITIANNHRYCAEHGLIIMADDGDGCAYEVYPFIMDLTNRNFGTFWSSLGFDVEYCGRIDARIVLDRLKSADVALCLRETVHASNFISYGITQEQADRYIARLGDIAIEAARREEPIVWN